MPSALGALQPNARAVSIADLAGAATVERIHIAEALSYRKQEPRN